MRVFSHRRPIPSLQKIPLTRRGFLKGITSLGVLALLSYFIPSCSRRTEPTPTELPTGIDMALPEPRKDSDVSVEETLLTRRSIRTYSGEALTLEEVSQLLWAAQGITNYRGFRTAPSAGATYPLETYVVVGDVENLSKGVYRYEPVGHKLVKVLDEDCRTQLVSAAVGQTFIKERAIDMVFTAIYERTTWRYGDRGVRYVHMEAGHAAQNVYLQAVALGLGTVVIGAFSDEQVHAILKLPENETPLYFMPVGRR